MDRAKGSEATSGQVLVIFVFFLTVLLGSAALAIDYGNWLLADRDLQNAADSAALAGAAEFRTCSATDAANGCQVTLGSSCTGVAVPYCTSARVEAWNVLQRALGFPANVAATYGGSDTGPAGVSIGAYRVWIDTPPNAAGGAGAAYPGSLPTTMGAVFVRVDHDVQSFLARALGMGQATRTGWATASLFSMNYAMATFCGSKCTPSGINLDPNVSLKIIKGDIGGNDSLKMGSGNRTNQVWMDSGTTDLDAVPPVYAYQGQVYLVNPTCGGQYYSCPVSPTVRGGIVDTSGQMLAAIPMSTIPTPTFAGALPSEFTSNPNPGTNWTCPTEGCGTWNSSAPAGTSPIQQCVGPNVPTPKTIQAASVYTPLATTVAVGATSLVSPLPTALNAVNDYIGGTDDWIGSTAASLANASGTTWSFKVRLASDTSLTQSPTALTLYYWSQSTGSTNGSAQQVQVRPTITPGTGTPIVGTWSANLAKSFSSVAATQTASSSWDQLSYSIPAANIPAIVAANGSIDVQIDMQTSTAVTKTTDRRGVNVAFVALVATVPVPSTEYRIPPGAYQSVTVTAGQCAVFDPTYVSTRYTTPVGWRGGIYVVGQTAGTGTSPQIQVNSGAVLAGDGVSVFLNPRLDFNVDTSSTPGLLQLNVNDVSGIRGGSAAWRVSGSPFTGYSGSAGWTGCPGACTFTAPATAERGVTIFMQWALTNQGLPSPSNGSRFGQSTQGLPINFQGLLLAPQDTVRLATRSNASGIGSIFAWTIELKGSASLTMQYDFLPVVGAPYLLEPGLNQ